MRQRSFQKACYINSLDHTKRLHNHFGKHRFNNVTAIRPNSILKISLPAAGHIGTSQYSHLLPASVV